MAGNSTLLDQLMAATLIGAVAAAAGAIPAMRATRVDPMTALRYE